MKSALAYSTILQPIEFVVAGMSGLSSTNYRALMEALIPAVKPTHVMFAGFCPNDGGTGVTAANVEVMRRNFTKAVRAAQANGAAIGLWSGLPRNLDATGAASRYTLTDDNIRKAWIAEMKTFGWPVADFSALAGVGESPERLNPLYTPDGVHLNDLGDDTVTPEASRIIRDFAYQYFL